MDSFPSTLKQVKSSGDEKYDVVYMNTPWNRLSFAQMSKMAVHELAKDNSLLYIWADSFTMSDTIELIKNFDYKFESVYQVCDVATYPSPSVPKPRVVKMDVVEETKPRVDEGVEETKEETPEGVGVEVVEEIKKTPLKRLKKLRCPPLTVPKYWTDTKRGTSRGTTEYLLLAYRGDPDVFTTLSNEKSSTLPYQVISKPELGKKSRSVPKKNIFLDPEWNVDRPEEFLNTVQAHLKPGTKILELFGSSIRDSVDSLGPNIPGGFVNAYTSSAGITGAMNKTFRKMRKVQLQSIVSSLTKMGQTDDRDVKVTEFKKIADLWTLVKKALVDMKTDTVSYDWGCDDMDLCAEWLRLLVLFFATKNCADFSNSRRRKKKRTQSKGPRSLHGIAAARPVSKELTDFLGLPEGTEVSRTHVVKMLNVYVKENKLQNPEKKVQILPDEKLMKLLDPPQGEVITYFRMCSFLSRHFPKTKSAMLKEAKEAAEKEGNSVDNVNIVEDDTTEPAAKKVRTD